MNESQKPLSRAQLIGTCSGFLVVSYFTAPLPDDQAPTCSSPMSRHNLKSAMQSSAFLILTSSSNASTDSKMKRMIDTRPANVYVLNAKISVVHYHLRSGVLGMGSDRPGDPNKGLEVSDLKVIPLSIRCAKDGAAVRWASKGP